MNEFPLSNLLDIVRTIACGMDFSVTRVIERLHGDEFIDVHEPALPGSGTMGYKVMATSPAFRFTIFPRFFSGRGSCPGSGLPH